MPVEQRPSARERHARICVRQRRATGAYSLLLAWLLVFGLAGSAAAETIDVRWDLNDDPRVQGYVVSIGTAPRAYDVNVDVGNIDRFSFTQAQGGRTYYFAVRAYYPGLLLSEYSSEVSARAQAAPVLTNPGIQTSTVGQAASLTLQAQDPDGDVIVYDAAGLPPGLVLARSLGRIDGVATTAGVFSVVVTASDGVLSSQQAFTWTIVEPPRVPPVLVNPGTQATAQFQAVALQLQATGSSGTRLVYSATGLPPGLTLSSSSGLISGAPGVTGTFTVVAAVSDGSLSTSVPFAWTIAAPSRGDEPAADTRGPGNPPPASDPPPAAAPPPSAPVPNPPSTPSEPVPAQSAREEDQATGLALRRPSSTSELTGSVAVRLPVRRTTQDLPLSKRRDVVEGSVEKSGSAPNTTPKEVPTVRALLQAPSDSPVVSEVVPIQTPSDSHSTSDAVAAVNQAPTIAIATPIASIVVRIGTPVILSATAADAEDGPLSGSIVWTSSVQGTLGNGGAIHRTLEPGVHRVTASVVDADGRTATAVVVIAVR